LARFGSDPGFRRTPAQLAGGDAEERAAAYLAARGLVIVARNYCTRLGEIDLVARDGEVLVFVEVRMRSDGGFGGALESVTPGKQRRIAAAAGQYLARIPRPPPCRFDVLAVDAGEIRWLKGAFDCA
jgi:putative endonuclease